MNGTESIGIPSLLFLPGRQDNQPLTDIFVSGLFIL